MVTLPWCIDSCDQSQEAGIQAVGKAKKKTYLSSGLEIKLLLRTTLLINSEHPGRVNDLFIPAQNVGCTSQEEQAAESDSIDQLSPTPHCSRRLLS